MLQKMRDNLQGWAAKVIVGLIVITMAMFGFGAFDFFSQADPAAATVNGEEITQNQLATEVERQRQRIAAQLGNIDPSTLDDAMLRNSVLEGLINRALLLEVATDMGLAVSEADVDKAIVGNADFQTDGVFDQDRFRSLLAGAGHSPLSFRSELASSYRLVQLSDGVNETPFVTEAERRALARLLAQTRDVAVLVFDPADVGASLTITDEEIEEFYASRPDDYMTEESVDLAYVELSVAGLAADPAIVVDEEEILARYEADREVFAGSEQRRASHILIEITDDRSEADARALLLDAKQRVLAGESFSKLAGELSEDPGSAGNGGDLGFVNKGAFVPEFEEVVWNLAPSEISEPITTQFGVHLIQLNEIKADTYPSLEERRAEVVASLRRSKAEELYIERVRRLDEIVFENPSDLTTATAELGLAVQEALGVTRKSATGVLADPKILTAAFSSDVLDRGFNSRVVDLGDRALSVRALKHVAAERRPLADVRDEIRTQIALERGREEARSRAENALNRVLAGDGTATIAADAGVDWKVHDAVRRSDPNVNPAILRAAFELPRPDVSNRVATVLDLPDGGVAVVMATAVKDGDYAALSDQERAALASQVEQAIGNMEFTALFESARADASIARR